MSSRATIFASIRRSLGISGEEALRREMVTERLARHPKGIVPERGQLSGHSLVSLFKDMVIASAATLEHVASADDVPQAVAAYLRANNLPSTLRHGADRRIGAMPWHSTTIRRLEGASDGHDAVGLSHAIGAVAETGTLLLASGPDNPTTVNFLPDDHVIIVDAADIVGPFEDFWPRFRSLGDGALPPRTLNMITGPSRSGDIEQKLLFGAHGPRRVHVIVVGGRS